MQQTCHHTTQNFWVSWMCKVKLFEKKYFPMVTSASLGQAFLEAIRFRRDMMPPNKKRWCLPTKLLKGNEVQPQKKEKKTKMPLAWPIRFEYSFCHWIGPTLDSIQCDKVSANGLETSCFVMKTYSFFRKSLYWHWKIFLVAVSCHR